MTRKRKPEPVAEAVTYKCLTCRTDIPAMVAASLRPRVGSARIEWCPSCEALTNQRVEVET